MRNWLVIEFKPATQRHGMQVLHDDMRFIDRTLNLLPAHKHRSIMREYIKKWQNILKNCENANVAQTLGRINANEYLRDLVDQPRNTGAEGYT